MSSDDFEWDATAAPPPTAWSTTATASRPARGRRAVYGSRSNRGPPKLYGRNRAGIITSSNASSSSNSKSALVREESIGPLDELDEAGGFDAAAAASIDHERHPSDENIRNGSGLGRSNASMSINSTLDSSISSAGTAGAGAAFDAGAPNSAATNTSGTTMRFPPRPNGGSGINGHSRSNSASGLPGRPPASASSSVSSSASSFQHHQRSASFMSPMGGGIVGSGSLLLGTTASSNGRSTSLTALEGIDRENYHPNHPPTSSSLNNTPQKVFGASLSAPNSAAPSPSQPGFDDEVSSISSRHDPNRRTKKTRTASDGDTAAIAAFSSGRGGAGGPTPRPMSVPISSPMSSNSVTSSTSFSSLSRMGDMAPTWVKRSLQDGIGRASSASLSAAASAHARRPSLDLNPSNSASLGPSPGFSSSTAHAYNANPNLSSPTRSIAAGSTASSRKRGVCDSPLLDGDDIVYSPGGSAGMMSCSSRRSRARSRIFSPDSTKKLMARAARGTGCGVFDDDFLRSSVGTDGSNHSQNGRHSSFSLSQQSFEGADTTTNPFAAAVLSGTAPAANDDSSHHRHHRRGGGHRKRDGRLHPEDSDDDSEDDDDDHSNSSMVDASMETEGSEPAGIAMSSRLHAHRKNDNDDDPTARLFGASGDGDGDALPTGPPVLSQMSPPPRANRRSRSDTFAESVFGSADGGDSFAMAASPEKRGGGACNLDESLVASPDDKTIAGDDADTVVGADEQQEKEEDPLEDVSSYEDLKYLIKILRKWSNCKNAASFGAGTGCTIAIPAKWSQARRQSFLNWSIQGLGFNIDSVQQGKARSIKAPARKATKIHQDLEAKLLRHKELTGHSTGAPIRTGASSKARAADETESKSHHPLFASTSQMVASSKSASNGNGVPRSVVFPQRSKDVDVDLLCNMDSLALDESVSLARPSKVAHRAATAAAPAATTNSSKNKDHGTPLVRVVTLDPRKDDGVSSSALPCFAPMSVESKGAATPSFELARPHAPRHSGEYDSEDGAGSTAMMQHILHGYSPEEDDDDMDGTERGGRGGRGMGRRFGARPPRMSTGSTSTRPRSLGGRNLMPPVEETTPAPPSQIKMMSLVKATPTFDIATPMPEGPGFWGSRPIPGKDWGTSEKCDAAILAVLLERLEKAYAESGYCDPNSPVPMITSQTPLTESTAKKNVAPLIPFMNQPISETVSSSAALGFDLEVDKKKSPIQLLRPKSRLNLDGAESDTDEEDDDEALEINGGDDFDADMGMGGMLNRRETTFEASRRRTTSTSGRASRGVYGGSSASNGRGLVRHGSVGATALSALVLNELGPSPDKLEKRRKMSLAVRKRMSLCAVAFDVKHSRRYTSSFAVAPSPAKFGKTRSSRRQTAFMAGGANVIAETSSIAEDDSTCMVEDSAMDAVLRDEELLSPIFSYLTEEELLVSASAVQTSWAEAATSAHATLMLVSVGCSTSFVEGGDDEDDDSDDEGDDATTDGSSSMMQMVDNTTGGGGNSNSNGSIAKSMERSWHFLNDKFPWATFLSEGAFKRVYRVWNSTVNAEEAVSVMDVDAIEDMGNKEIVGAELSVSVLLSSLVRRNVCPNFVVTRGVFTCPYEPASSHWGCAENKKPMGSIYDPNRAQREGLPATPSEEERGKFQYIRMELCRHGDMEEWLKTQPGQGIGANEARMLFFQMAFALHAAADRYSMKHYDVKLLNFFLQSANDDSIDNGNATNGVQHPYTVLRYGIGASVFGLRMPTSRALIAKLADYGTANIRPESNGQPVTIGQFTTLENSPPEFLISGDAAKQGYGHDSFGLGLCMLHLFTGHAPYEEILEDVRCPVALKRKLKNIWENPSSNGYDVLRSVILADVYEDEDGNVEGEPDEVLYDTLYRYLVLFGIPDKKCQYKEGARVWRAITSCLIGQVAKSAASASVPARRSTRRNAARANTAAVIPAASAGPDASQYEIDTSLYSLRTGTDSRIADARQKLEAMDGGMELLLSLVSFDPSARATPLDAINSAFFGALREEDGMDMYGPSDEIKSFMAMGYAT